MRKIKFCLRSPAPVWLLIAALLASACGPNASIINSGTEPAPSSNGTAVSDFERDLQSMRTADFDFIYVFRRKDGGKFDAEDRGAIKLYTVDTNRRTVSDDERAVIVGSNYRIPPENLRALIERFAMTDHSKPESEIRRPAANANGPANGA